jgi:hypothetical protein
VLPVCTTIPPVVVTAVTGVTNDVTHTCIKHTDDIIERSFKIREAIATVRLVPKDDSCGPRTGNVYELTVYGDDAPSRSLQAKLEDIQVRDERGILQYRTYRGRQVPVYKPPHGLGLLQKERGKARSHRNTNIVRWILCLIATRRNNWENCVGAQLLVGQKSMHSA